MRMRLALGLSVAILALTACADEGGGGSGGASTDPDDLIGVVWRLDDPSIEVLQEGVPDVAVVSLEFADGSVSGRSACNSYFGDYTADDDGSLSFGALGGTEMACEEPLMALEAAYLSALSDVTGFSLDEGALTLRGGEVALTFFEEVPPAPLPVVGTTWNLTSIYTGDAVSTAIAGSEATMTLMEDGSVTGAASCNRYQGTYALDGDRLSFSGLASTKMLCPDDIMNQETIFLEAMAAVEGFSIEGSSLTVTDGAGAPLLGFVGAGPSV
jgi:heat shock protein HslJ